MWIFHQKNLEVAIIYVYIILVIMVMCQLFMTPSERISPLWIQIFLLWSTDSFLTLKAVQKWSIALSVVMSLTVPLWWALSMTMVHHVLVLDQTLFNDVLEELQISKPRKFKKKSRKIQLKKKQFKLTFFQASMPRYGIKWIFKYWRTTKLSLCLAWTRSLVSFLI